MKKDWQIYVRNDMKNLTEKKGEKGPSHVQMTNSGAFTVPDQLSPFLK